MRIHPCTVYVHPDTGCKHHSVAKQEGFEQLRELHLSLWHRSAPNLLPAGKDSEDGQTSNLLLAAART